MNTIGNECKIPLDTPNTTDSILSLSLLKFPPVPYPINIQSRFGAVASSSYLSNGGTPLLHLLIQLTQAKVGAETRPENTDPRGSKNVFGLWFGLRADALISIYEFMCAPERESHPSAVNMECLGKQLARLGDLPKLKAICC